MTSRSDLARVFAALQVLGTEAETPMPDGRTKITLAWDTTSGWEYGPRKPPPQWDTVDHEPSNGGNEPPTDRDEEERQRHRASQHHGELVNLIATLDKATQSIFRLIDLAVPPNPAEMKNRRTGDYEPMTAAEVELNGYCSLCWSASPGTFCPIPVDSKGFKRWRDRCGWCGPFRAAHGVDPPKQLVVKHLEGRNVHQADIDEALKTQAKKKRKGKKRAAA